MYGFHKPTWSSYLWYGSIAVIASWVVTGVLTGCRFGNRVEYKQPLSDGISGYYETQVQSVLYCTTLTTSATSSCKNAPLSQAPAAIARFMTNPTELYYQDGKYYFHPPGTTVGFPVFADPDGSLYGQIPPQTGTFWKDPACTNTFSFEEKGSFRKTSGPWTSGMENTYPLVGRINMKFTEINTFSSSCGQELQDALACYQDFQQCGEPTDADNQKIQDELRAMFGPYIESGTMTVNDIPKVSGFGYEVSYD